MTILKWIYSLLGKWLGKFAGVAAVATVTLLIFAMAPYITSGLDALHSGLSTAKNYMQQINFGGIYSKLNTIFPLYECILMTSGLFTIKVSVFVMRAILAVIQTFK